MKFDTEFKGRDWINCKIDFISEKHDNFIGDQGKSKQFRGQSTALVHCFSLVLRFFSITTFFIKDSALPILLSQIRLFSSMY